MSIFLSLKHIEQSDFFPHSFVVAVLSILLSLSNRGLIAIQILKELQKLMMGKPVREAFDYVCGVSTGGLLAVMIAIHDLPMDKCEKMYKVGLQSERTTDAFTFLKAIRHMLADVRSS